MDREECCAPHGGRIDVTSRGTGKGATVTVRLPNIVPVLAQPAAPRATGNGHAMANKRILLADDNRDAAQNLAIILRLEGHDVARRRARAADRNHGLGAGFR